MPNLLTGPTRSYTVLSQIPTLTERLLYLQLEGGVGNETFGFDRWLTQKFYNSPQWRALRTHVILRDLGCETGHLDYPILGRPIVHHMNPIQEKDLLLEPIVLDAEFLTTVSHLVHNRLHYGKATQYVAPPTHRLKGDTKLW